MKKRPNLPVTIESMVQAILTDINDKHPNTMDELMQKNEFSNERTTRKAGTENVAEPSHGMTAGPTAFELLRASLGVIFQERYGWTDEVVDSMTLPQVFIALEHAMEYDAPFKKSVWKL